MKVNIQFEKDAEASSCNWQEVEKRVRIWADSFATTPPPIILSEKKQPISLDLATNNLPAAIQELHRQLYDHQVNFTLVSRQ